MLKTIFLPWLRVAELSIEAYMEFDAFGEVPEAEALANARLIAAAPDLYAAAFEAYEVLRIGGVLPIDGMLAGRLRAALEAATGSMRSGVHVQVPGTNQEASK